MCTIYVTYMAFRIYGAYMSVLHGEYMSNDIYLTYIAHLYVHICMHRCDQYKWHIRHLTYTMHICQYYVWHIYRMAYKLLILCAYMCMYACLYVPNIGNTYDIWHIRCIYVSDIGSIYVNSHICYLYCTLIERNINYIYDIWHIRHICSIYGVYVPLGGAIFAYIKL